MIRKSSWLTRIPTNVMLIERGYYPDFVSRLYIAQKLGLEQFTGSKNSEEYINGY